jgi:hypothetical protein
MIEQLRHNPSCDVIETIAEAVAKESFPKEQRTLQDALNFALTNAATSGLAWKVLANHPLPACNPALSMQLFTTRAPQNDMFLLCLKNTKSRTIQIQLLEIALSQDTVLTAEYDKLKLLDVAFEMQPVFTIAVLLDYYTPADRRTNTLSKPIAAKLTNYLASISSHRDAFATVLPRMMAFVLGEKNTLPFQVGAPGSPRFVVAREIQNLLIKQDTPVAASALLIFLDCDSPELAAKAAAYDYSALKAAPWLIPTAFAWGAHLQPLRKGESEMMKSDKESNTQRNNAKYFRCPSAISLVSNWEIRIPFTECQSFPLLSLYKASSTHWHFLPDPVDQLVSSNAIRAEEETLAVSVSASISSALGRKHSQQELIQGIKDRREEASIQFGQDLPALYAAQVLLRTDISSVFTNISTSAADSTSDFLVYLEMRRRALLVYAVAQFNRQNGLQQAELPRTSRIDQDFASLLRNHPPGLNTRVVPQIAFRDDNKASATTAQILSKPQKVAIKVRQRELCFVTDTYHETLEIIGDGTRSFTMDWVGDIPLPLLAALKQQPRLLDFLDISLAERELKILAKDI